MADNSAEDGSQRWRSKHMQRDKPSSSSSQDEIVIPSHSKDIKGHSLSFNQYQLSEVKQITQIIGHEFL